VFNPPTCSRKREMAEIVNTTEPVKWFHVLTDPLTGDMYPTLKAMPEAVLQDGAARIMTALRRHHPQGNLDIALDCYNTWKSELERRRILRELDLHED
jgi:hypothetical protein